MTQTPQTSQVSPDESQRAIASAKAVVRGYQQALDNADIDGLAAAIGSHVSADYHWRGMHPFYEQRGAQAVCAVFWQPLRAAFSALQRREDIFFGGYNDVETSNDSAPAPDATTENPAGLWVCSMGHYMGLFDAPWLGIRPTGRMVFLRYAEFHRVVGERIAETALFCDIVSIMQQAGQYPLAPQTGAAFVHPGPRTHDGIVSTPQPPAETAKTMALVNRMIADLLHLNESETDRCSIEYLAETWHSDMIWFGPAGIGASYTIERYQHQHQFPFREGLKEKKYNGHVARLAEGSYAGFFGWSNLTNRLAGGLFGMPEGSKAAEMRVVDIYRRDGDKLAENWIFIDLLHYLSMQGLDILHRSRQLLEARHF